MPTDDLDDLYDDDAIADAAKEIADAIDAQIMKDLIDIAGQIVESMGDLGFGVEGLEDDEVSQEPEETPQDRYDRAMDVFKDL